MLSDLSREQSVQLTDARSSHKYDMITVGSATVDVFAHTDPEQAEVLNIHHHKDIAYPLGAKILIKELNIFVGGGGTNTSVAFSRMGMKTGFLGKIGKDDNGKTINDCLFRENVDFLGTFGEISGYSVVLDSVAEDRTIFTYKGCNDELMVSDVDFDILDTQWLYMSSMMKDSFETQCRIAAYLYRKGVKIAYNPSMYTVTKGASHLKPILKKTEIIVFNKEEARALVKQDGDNIFNLLLTVAKLGPKIVVVTDGSNGSYCFNSYDETVYSARPSKCKIIETTGAGDAFASGFVAAIATAKSVEMALKCGMLNAESVIKHLGAKNDLLGPEIWALAEKDHRTIFKKKI